MDALAPGHFIVVAIVALVLFFGWKQLPDMSRSLGRSLRIFKTEIKGMVADDEVRTALRDTVADARGEFTDAATSIHAVPAASGAVPAATTSPATALPATTSPATTSTVTKEQF